MPANQDGRQSGNNGSCNEDQARENERQPKGDHRAWWKEMNSCQEAEEAYPDRMVVTGQKEMEVKIKISVEKVKATHLEADPQRS